MTPTVPAGDADVEITVRTDHIQRRPEAEIRAELN